MKAMRTLRGLLCAAILSCPGALAQVPEAFTIGAIRVEGLERIDEGTVFNYLPLAVGDLADAEEASLGIKALFDTGFFRDVQLHRDGDTLVVRVVERPSLAEVTFGGNDAIDNGSIEQALEQADLVAGRIFNRIALEQLRRELQAVYLSLGHYASEVQAEITELPRNRVSLAVNISEGRAARIRDITFIGAEQIEADELKGRMQLKERRGLKFISKPDQYSRQKLAADLETIRSYYLDRGFHDFEIASYGVDISPNQQDIFITITINEGVRYRFGQFSVESDTSLDLEALRALIQAESGEPFSRSDISRARAAMTDWLAVRGYAYAEVRPVLDADAASQEVSVVFSIAPNQLVHVRRINITGNAFTRDEVVRRELRQLEGSLYSSEALRLSRIRLRRLGFFSAVDIDTLPVTGVPDQVDIEVRLTERNTGTIQFSTGYSDDDGIIVGLAYQQRNLFGTGRELQLEVNNSDAARTFVADYTNPFYTDSGVSRTLRFSQRRIETDNVDTAEYHSNSTSLGVNYRIPVAETNSLRLGFAFDQIDLRTTVTTPAELSSLILAQPEADQFLVRTGLSRDERNDFFLPTQGHYSALNLELAAPGSDYTYYKLDLTGSYYRPLGDHLSAKFSAQLGYADGYGDTVHLPFFENYFIGGSKSVRGFGARSLGPRDTGPTPRPLGGDRRILLNAELLLPAFGGEIEKDRRLSVFLDGGMVFGNIGGREDFDLGELRYSTGISFAWFSPIGPFSLSYAFPLRQEDADDIERFQISFGAVFR